MKRIVMIGAVAGLAMVAVLMAQSRSFEKFTVEGQPIDKRKPELDTDHPVFPGQTHAPYHKTTDVAVTTIDSGLDNPWAVALLPSGHFLITEKPGRLRIIDRDGSALHTITAGMPPVYYRGQAGLLADNGVGLTLANSTLTGNTTKDLQLTFGTRADVSTTVFGTFTCDATVLVRGTSGIICPH